MRAFIYMGILFFIIISLLGCSIKEAHKVNSSHQSTSISSTDNESASLPNMQILDMDKARLAINAFREVGVEKIIQNFNPVILKDITIKTRLNGAFLSRCDIDVIKAIIASGWAPSVVLQTPGGQKHIRVVIGYNDPPRRIILVDFKDPARFIQLDEGYDDFEKQWDRNTCVIIDRNVSEASIKPSLSRYLSSEKIMSVGITTRVN